MLKFWPGDEDFDDDERLSSHWKHGSSDEPH